MTQPIRRSQRLTAALFTALVVGAVATGVCILLGLLGLFGHGESGVGGGQFFRSWLFAWVFWLGVSLGSMVIVMLHHLTGGGWGYMIRRFAENAALVTPVMIVLFIPILIGVRAIYPWADPNVLAHDPVVAHKAAKFLNWPFWTIRSIVYLVALSAIAYGLRTRSLINDRTGEADSVSILARLRRLSAGGMVAYFVLMSLGSIDWIMSREPHWYSTVFGFIVCISQAVSACSFLIIMLWVFADEDEFRRVIQPNYLNDIGNVLLTFVILWAYLSFSQFIVTWLGNKQDEITWYVQRTDGGWRWVAGAIIAFHFFVPFFLLLQRPLKQKTGRLAAIAAVVFFIHIIDELYWITPSHTEKTAVHGVGAWLFVEAMNVAAFVGVGGLWLAAYLFIQKGAPVLTIGARVPVIPVDHGHGQRPTPGALG